MKSKELVLLLTVVNTIENLVAIVSNDLAENSWSLNITSFGVIFEISFSIIL